MPEWIANGARLGWLIDPDRRSVTIYRPEGPAETPTRIDSIAGEGPVAGFVLDLSAVWNPLGE
jgi:Uma2 family endonuclease